MTRQEMAAAKRARRATRNEAHPGAFSAVRAVAKTIPGGRWWNPTNYIPAIADRAAAVARLAREMAKGRQITGNSATARNPRDQQAKADIQHHRGGDR